jgi:hypothetical protein
MKEIHLGRKTFFAMFVGFITGLSISMSERFLYWLIICILIWRNV